MQFVLLTIALCLGTFLMALDISIANVAVPHIAGALGVSNDDGTWVITSFAAANAVVMPMTGWLVKKLGDGRLFSFATAGFALASAACAFSPDITALVISRVIQGAFSGVLMPLSQSLLLRTWPKRLSGMALGLWAMVVVIGPVLGPILGGWITDNYSWGWIFLINLPIGLFCALVTFWQLGGEPPEGDANHTDWMGFLLLILWVSCLQVFLDRGNELDWWDSPFIVTLGCGALIGFVYFLIWELYHPNPIVRLDFFKIATFSQSVVIGCIGSFLIFGPLVILPLWLQGAMGYTATVSGLAMAPIGILSIFLGPFCSWVTRHCGSYLVIAFAFAMVSLTFFSATLFYTDSSLQQIQLNRFLQGLGLAFFLMPTIQLGLSEIPQKEMSAASGLFNFCRMLAGMAIGVSMLVTLWTRRQEFHHARLVETTIPAALPVREVLTSQPSWTTSTEHWCTLDQLVNQQASTLAMEDVFYLAGWLGLVVVPAILFLHFRHRRRQDLSHQKRPSPLHLLH